MMDKSNQLLVAQKIYDSEINFKISAPCWDGGFTVSLCPDGPYDGTWLVNAYVDTFAEAIEKLIELVLKHHPESKFAKEWVILNNKKFEEHQLLLSSMPLIEYLKDNHNPHCIAIISTDNIEILEGLKMEKVS